jgi:hypothetical protein
MLDEQTRVTKKGGTMRLGAQPCQLVMGTKAQKLYGSFVVNERHRHRYEFNNSYRERFEKAGFTFSGFTPDGKLVNKAESVFLAPTDFSPAVTPTQSKSPMVYELRTYHATPGKREKLLARFRDHTTGLFAKHGMSQFGYWVPTDKKDEDILIYVLAHRSPEACAESFKAFRADPDWIKVKAESEADGSLTVRDGVQSVLMAPTDFSPAK